MSPDRDQAEGYSPQLRTALVLGGTGTSGAYHAGVLRALHEAGVKIDIIGAHGIGVVGALFAAIDGAARVWDEKGFWRSRGVVGFYPWSSVLRLGVLALIVAVAIVLVPIFAVALGLVVFPVDFLLRMIGVGGAGLVGAYLLLIQRAFASDGLPTWAPRAVVVVLAAFIGVAVTRGFRSPSGRQSRGPLWWRFLPAPMSAAPVIDHCWRTLWDLVRGATRLRQPDSRELARRYGEMLAENLGQPGFRELVITVHDIDARRDLVFALVADPARRDLVRGATSAASDARRAEIFDLRGTGRDYLADVIAAAVTVPAATDPHPLTFAADSYWRGETHRLCDRPAALARLIDELTTLGVDQAIMVSAVVPSRGPHTLSPPRLDPRARFGEYLQAAEAAAVRDVVAGVPRPLRLFIIAPEHNPVGPFDFGGGFDDRSDRRHSLTELMTQGYEDAYRQFIEPVVGASGEQVGEGVS